MNVISANSGPTSRPLLGSEKQLASSQKSSYIAGRVAQIFKEIESSLRKVVQGFERTIRINFYGSSERANDKITRYIDKVLLFFANLVSEVRIGILGKNSY